jgi:hypothetical protein
VSIYSAWTPALGLAITDETGGGLGSSCQFEHGTISWSPLGGARVTFNNGQDPGQPPGGPVPTQPPGLGLPDVTEPIGALLALLNNVLGGLGSSVAR